MGSDRFKYRKALDDLKRQASIAEDVQKRDQLEREIQKLLETRAHNMELYQELEPMATELARLNKLIAVKSPKAPRKPKPPEPQAGSAAVAVEGDE